MKLNVNTTPRQVTTDDLYVYVDPPLVFEVVNRLDRETNNLLSQWSNANFDPSLALDIVPRIFYSVSQNGDKYPIKSQQDAKELAEAIGPDLLSELIEGFWDHNYRFFQKRRTAYEASLAVAPNGHKTDK